MTGAANGDRPRPRRVVADLTALSYRNAFDTVTAARVLQWLRQPLEAMKGMVAALKPGGQLIVLDYNHLKTCWEPEPPASFRRSYDAFLEWRAEAGMDNEIADHLAAMMGELGLSEVRVSDEHEVTTSGDADFETRIALWGKVLATRGHQIVADGMLTEAERALAERQFSDWAANDALRQELYLLGVAARKR